MTSGNSLAGLARLYTDLGRELSSYDTRSEALAGICRIAVNRIPGTEWASISEGRGGIFRTVAATDDEARAVDLIQYELEAGPCVDAILTETVFRTDDLRQDRRWPDFGERVAEVSEARSMLSLRLFIEDDDRIAGLNLYSTALAAFDDRSELVGSLTATHGALAIQMAAARETSAHLQRALISNREIGTAMGVLMTRYKVTRDQAFDLLRMASQGRNRKLVDIALDVTDSGTLDLPEGWNVRRRAGGRPRPTPATGRTPDGGGGPSG